MDFLSNRIWVRIFLGHPVSNNYVFENDLILNSRREKAANYELCPTFTYSIGYW